MSQLLIDLGNSRLKWRRWSATTGFGEGGLREHADTRLAPALAQDLAFAAGMPALVASVARPALKEQLETLSRDLGIPLRWAATPRQGLGLQSCYPDPRKWGVDRWLALAAAHADSRAACCVVDIGTAITVDICDAQGRQQGGIIAPGPVALLRALSQHTALPAAADQWPDRLALATVTEEALLRGAQHAACGAIERCCTLAAREHACAEAILTGGGARLLSPYLQTPHRIDGDLVFKGLTLLAADTPRPSAL